MDTILAYIQSRGISLLEDVVVAFLIVFIGFKVTKWIVDLCIKAMQKTKVEQTLVSFLTSILTYALKGIILFSALTRLGFPTGSLVAILGTVGAAVALGLKDSLGSFASGVLIMLLKPIVVGDYIEVAGQGGTVKEIQIMNTILMTPDNKHILIPNNQMTGATIVNYSKEATRRVDVDFGVSYNTDIELAKNLISKVIMNHPMSLTDPEPFVRVTNYADSAIIITLRVWTESANYWNLKFDLLEQVKAEFDKNGIEIPFNQIDVNIKKD